MCGIAGFLPDNKKSFNCINTINSMLSAISHRGPNDHGVWFNSSDNVYLGHCRLAIMDLSDAGHQPMISQCGRWVIIFNGEIYNHLELRKKLSDDVLLSNILPAWRGHSDTETLLACISSWGIDKTLQLAVGMFAISLWDRQYKTLVLIRDRFGEKPLYYGFVNGSFVFASELKAIRKFNNFDNKIDLDALNSYVTYSAVPAPASIYNNINKLLPGNMLILKNGSTTPIIKKYWCPVEIAIKSSHDEKYVSDNFEDLIHEQLIRSISGQMLSDKPIGCFLSGGIDSSLVASIMQALSTSPINTYTIAFESKKFDESLHSRKIAQKIGSNHHELLITSLNLLNAVPEMAKVYDEPFADTSQIPTYLLSKYSSVKSTVILTGDGADEIFGGYNRYMWAPHINRILSKFPLVLRPFISNMLNLLSQKVIDNNFIGFEFKLIRQLGDKLNKAAKIIRYSENQDMMYAHLVSNWVPHDSIVVGAKNNPYSILNSDRINDSFTHYQERMMLQDTLHYLHDVVLTKVDRASMANSIEVRAPFLNHKLFEIAWSFNLAHKIDGLKGKIVLRNILERYMPLEYFNRPKSGFSTPVSDWLRGPLKEWGEYHIYNIRKYKYFNEENIKNKWMEHMSNKSDWSNQLWTILMFQSWYEEQAGC